MSSSFLLFQQEEETPVEVKRISYLLTLPVNIITVSINNLNPPNFPLICHPRARGLFNGLLKSSVSEDRDRSLLKNGRCSHFYSLVFTSMIFNKT